MALPLAWAFEITPDGVRRTQGPVASRKRPGRSGRAVTLAVLVALVAIWSFHLRPDEGHDPGRVAVLAFENRTGDEALDPIGQMTADGITQHLARTGLVELMAGPVPAERGARDTATNGAGVVGNERPRDPEAAIVVTGRTTWRTGGFCSRPGSRTRAAAGSCRPSTRPSSTAAGPRTAIDLLGERIAGVTSIFLHRYAEADSLRDVLMRTPDQLTPLELVQAVALDGLLNGDWAGFREAWEAGPDLAPSLNALFRAWAALRSERPADAVAILDELHPDRGGLLKEFEPFWDLLTTALHGAGQHRRELSEARSAAEHLPMSPLAVFLEVRALAALGRPDTALDRLRSTADGATGRTPWRLVEPLPDLGAAMLASARELRAHGHQDAARAATHDVSVVELRGALAVRLGDTASARLALADLEAPESRDSMGRRAFARARITYLLGQRDEALELLHEARALGYDVATAVHLDPELVDLPTEEQPGKRRPLTADPAPVTVIPVPA